jgi:hypothetical protein
MLDIFSSLRSLNKGVGVLFFGLCPKNKTHLPILRAKRAKGVIKNKH